MISSRVPIQVPFPLHPSPVIASSLVSFIPVAPVSATSADQATLNWVFMKFTFEFHNVFSVSKRKFARITSPVSGVGTRNTMLFPLRENVNAERVNVLISDVSFQSPAMVAVLVHTRLTSRSRSHVFFTVTTLSKLTLLHRFGSNMLCALSMAFCPCFRKSSPGLTPGISGALRLFS